MKFKSYLVIVLFAITVVSGCISRKKATASEMVETVIDEVLNAPNKSKKVGEHPAKKGWPPKF